MKSIELTAVAELPVGSVFYVVKKFDVIINSYNFTIDLTADLSKHNPVVKFLKTDKNHATPINPLADLVAIEIIDESGIDSSYTDVTNHYKIFLDERDALTYLYKCLLGIRETSERFLKTMDTMLVDLNNSTYMTEHLKQFPEDFI